MHADFQGNSICMSVLLVQQLFSYQKIMVHRGQSVQATPKASSSGEPGVESSGVVAKAGTVTLASGRVLVRAKPKAKVAPKRFYALTSGPPELLGIWHAQWQFVAGHLPGGKLFGSGCVLSGHDDRESADAKWYLKWESEPPVHEQP